MPEYTDNYKLSVLRAGEHFSADTYKFTDADRRLIDRLLFLGAEGHRHRGGSIDLPTVDVAPLLSIEANGGSMPAGRRYFYKYTLVDTNGFESSASPEAFIDTPPSVSQPDAPILSLSGVGGTLPPGNYYYVLSAYTQFDNMETLAGNAAFVSVPYSNGTTNTITLTLPTLPGGADGFNVYRRTPSGSAYYHIGSIDMASEPTTWADNGSRMEDCDRYAPEVSTAMSRSGINVAIPGVVPIVPAGYAWRVYRTTQSGDYAQSLVGTIVDGSVVFLDQGSSTQSGQPPTQGIAPGAPSQIDLTDAAEVQGRLPVSAVSAWPHEVTFSFPGSVTASQGVMTWVCPFPQARLLSVRGVLGRGRTAVGDVTFNAVVQQDGEAAWVAVLTSNARIGNGGYDTVASGFAVEQLQAGDKLSVDVMQSDAANMHLTIVVSMYLYGFTDAASEVWETLR